MEFSILSSGKKKDLPMVQDQVSRELKTMDTFIASSRVRTNSTLESVTIFKTEMEKYRKDIPQEYIDFTKSSLLKGNALRFETLGSLLGMLNTMTCI